MISNMEGFYCREAAISDQAGLEELSRNIYNVADYTLHMFPQWLDDPNWKLYVAEVSSGQIVAFLGLCITDSNTRVTVRSARVAKSKRKSGLFGY